MKRIYKVIMWVVCAVLFTTSLFACGGGKKTGTVTDKVDTVKFYISHIPDISDNDAVNDANFDLIKKCGIDSVQLAEYQVGEIGGELCNKVINLCEKHGLDAMPHLRNAGSSDEVSGDGAMYNTDMTQFSNVEFLVMFDEPKYQDIADMSTWVPRFNSFYKDKKSFFVCLFPEYSDVNSCFDGHSYKEYVEAYCNQVLDKLVCSKWLSTDIYPYRAFAEERIENKWLSNLEILRYAANKFENCHLAMDIQTCSMTDRACRVVTVNDIRQQIYAGLLYGVEMFGLYT